MLKNITYIILLALGIGLGLIIPRFVATAPADAHSPHADSAETTHSSRTASLNWCLEHRVPEAECTLCHPELTARFKAEGDWCSEHKLPESHCRLCHPSLSFPQETLITATQSEPIRTSVFFPANSSECANDQVLIQFASAETAARAGLTVEPALATAEFSPVEAPAEVCFDETRISLVTISVPATVVRWLAEPGEKLKAGQSLAEVESPDVSQLEANFLQAAAENAVRRQEFARLTSLRERGLLSVADFEAAEGAVQTSEAQLAGSAGLLRAAGLSDADIAGLARSRRISPRYVLRTSIQGVLVERRAPLGELLPEGSSLALVGNPDALWIEAQVRESDLDHIYIGQSVEFSTDGTALDRIGGSVIWVAEFLDKHTRTGTVRAKLSSSNPTLRANRFGRARFHRSEQSGVSIPRDAVQWEGCCNVVFVQEAPERYRLRKVTVERGETGYYRITSGLVPGEPVVIKGSYLLKTELKRGSIGAGCCGIEAKS